jgi:hypothetical protein
MAYTPTSNITEGTWDAGNPSDLDYLKPNGFRFQVHNIPNVSFFCQSANIPEISIGQAQMATPLQDYYEPGEKLAYGELLIRFLIQENMANYNELHNWMVGLGSPEDSDQYKEYADSQRYRFPQINEKKARNLAIKSDATLFVLDSNNNPATAIQFKDAFPISLSGLEFDVTDTEYFVGTAIFRYLNFKVEAL